MQIKGRSSLHGRRAAAAGEVVAGAGPEWAALERVLGAGLCRWFDWLYEVSLSDGVALYAYRHRATRRCVHLSVDGAAFRLAVADTFVEVQLRPAVARTFVGWRRQDLSRGDIAALRAFFAGTG